MGDSWSMRVNRAVVSPYPHLIMTTRHFIKLATIVGLVVIRIKRVSLNHDAPEVKALHLFGC